jgi:hypothetical protein
VKAGTGREVLKTIWVFALLFVGLMAALLVAWVISWALFAAGWR